METAEDKTYSKCEHGGRAHIANLSSDEAARERSSEVVGCFVAQ